jgi:hypothetical protein
MEIHSALRPMTSSARKASVSLDSSSRQRILAESNFILGIIVAAVIAILIGGLIYALVNRRYLQCSDCKCRIYKWQAFKTDEVTKRRYHLDYGCQESRSMGWLQWSKPEKS